MVIVIMTNGHIVRRIIDTYLPTIRSIPTITDTLYIVICVFIYLFSYSGE
jgi:hypothetical protein